MNQRKTYKNLRYTARSGPAWEFAKLVRGASDVDLALLLSFHSLCNKVYMYNEELKACFHPEPGMVPWPIIFLAGRYSRKHIFKPPSVPKLHGIRKAMHHFGCKLKWRWCCKDVEGLH